MSILNLIKPHHFTFEGAAELAQTLSDRYGLTNVHTVRHRNSLRISGEGLCSLRLHVTMDPATKELKLESEPLSGCNVYRIVI